MAKQNNDVQIPGIDDRPMTKEQFAAMWERLSPQTGEVFLGIKGNNIFRKLLLHLPKMLLYRFFTAEELCVCKALLPWKEVASWQTSS